MRRQANKAGREEKQWKQGDFVRLKGTDTKGHTVRKLLRDYQGPYEIVSKDDDDFGNSYTIQRVGEGQKVKLQVHANRLGDYKDLMELDVRGAKELRNHRKRAKASCTKSSASRTIVAANEQATKSIW